MVSNCAALKTMAKEKREHCLAVKHFYGALIFCVYVLVLSLYKSYSS